MKITFTHKKKKTEIPIFGASEVKLYAVPVSYSDDGYFAAVWFAQDLEPVPACAVESVELLAHVRVMPGENDGYILQESFCKEGVKYAQN